MHQACKQSAKSAACHCTVQGCFILQANAIQGGFSNTAQRGNTNGGSQTLDLGVLALQGNAKGCSGLCHVAADHAGSQNSSVTQRSTLNALCTAQCIVHAGHDQQRAQAADQRGTQPACINIQCGESLCQIGADNGAQRAKHNVTDRDRNQNSDHGDKENFDCFWRFLFKESFNDGLEVDDQNNGYRTT